MVPGPRPPGRCDSAQVLEPPCYCPYAGRGLQVCLGVKPGPACWGGGGVGGAWAWLVCGSSFSLDHKLGFKLVTPWSPPIFLFFLVENCSVDLETTILSPRPGPGSLELPQGLPVPPRLAPSVGQAPQLPGAAWGLGGQGWLCCRGWQSSCVCK